MFDLHQAHVPSTTTRTPATGCCSCCATAYDVYKAGLTDVDDVTYPRLCGPCFDDVERETAPAERRDQFAQQMRDTVYTDDLLTGPQTPADWHRHIASAVSFTESQDRLEDALRSGITGSELLTAQHLDRPVAVG